MNQNAHEQNSEEMEVSEDIDTEQNTEIIKSTSRRGLMQGIAIGASAAAVGPHTIATASAEGSDDEDELDEHEAPDATAHDDPLQRYDWMTDSARDEMSQTVMQVPVAREIFVGGLEAHDVAGTGAAVGAVADWFAGYFGDELEDADQRKDQLELSTNAHARTIADNFWHMAEQNYNNFEMLDNNAKIAAEVAILQSLEANDSLGMAQADGASAIEDMIAIYEENFNRIVESAIVRLVNIRNRQVTAFGDDDDYEPTVHYQPRDTSEAVDYDPIGTRTIEIELVNSDKIETEALVASREVDDDDDTNGVIYGHPYFDSDLRDQVVDYDDLEDDAGDGTNAYISAANTATTNWSSTRGMYVEGYDSNNSRVRVFDVAIDIDNLTNDGSDNTAGWHHYVLNHVYDRSSTLVSDMQDYAEMIYDAYDAGDIEGVEDVISPYAVAEDMAGDVAETGDSGITAGLLIQGGMSGDLDVMGEFTHIQDDDEDTYDGWITWDPDYAPDKNDWEEEEEMEDGDWTITVEAGAGSTVHLESMDDIDVTAEHSDEDVDEVAVAIEREDEDPALITDSSGDSLTVEEDDFEEALATVDVGYGDDITLVVTAESEDGDSVEADVEWEILTETRIYEGETYDVSEDGTVRIIEQGEDDEGGMISLDDGDEVRIESFDDTDYLTVSDRNLRTLETDGLQDDWDAIIDSQRDIEERTDDDNGGGGGGGAALEDTNMLVYVVAALAAAFGISSVAAYLLEE